MLPLLSLMHPMHAGRLDAEACTGGGARRRPTTLFFRGAHGTEERAQAVRAKMLELRAMGPDDGVRAVDVRFTRGGGVRLSAKTRASLAAKDVRMPFNAEVYAAGMLRSDFCLLPRADAPNPGRRLIDAVAAGCVPMLIGDTLKLPLGKLLSYDRFTVRVPEADFVRMPRAAVAEALRAATPRLGELRRALRAARDELLLGTGTAPLAANHSIAHGADLILLEAGRAVCPRSPASFKACGLNKDLV